MKNLTFDSISTKTPEGRMLKVLLGRMFIRQESTNIDSLIASIPSSESEVLHMTKAAKKIQAERKMLDDKLKVHVREIMDLVDAKDQLNQRSK